MKLNSTKTPNPSTKQSQSSDSQDLMINTLKEESSKFSNQENHGSDNLPKGWQWVKLVDVCGKNGLMVDGDWVESKDQNPSGEVRLIQLADIGVGSFIDKSNRFLTKQKAKDLRCTFLQKHDVLIARMPDPIGRACIFPLTGDFVTVVDICICRPDAAIVDPNYLVHIVNSLQVQKSIQSLSLGSTRQRISGDNLKNIQIPLPPIEEQKRIAAILNKADRIRKLRKKSREIADTFLQSVFLEMFGDPVKNPKGWDVIELGEVCESITDCINKTAPSVDYRTPYRMIRTTNVKKGQINLLEVRYVEEDIYKKWIRREKPRKGDVVLTREAPLGEAGILEDDCNVFLGQRLVQYRVDLQKLNNYFLLHSILSKDLQNQIKLLGSGSTVEHITVPDCEKLLLKLPPLPLQNQFAEIVNKFEKQREKLLESERQAELLFQSLLDQAFRGEI